MKSKIILISLFIPSILLYYTGLPSDGVSSLYSNYFFSKFNFPFRYITDLLPFSIGDILYIILPLFIIFRIIFFFVKKRYKELKYYYKFFINIIFSTVLILFLFINLWGWNYQRDKISKELGLEVESYSDEDLESLLLILTDSVNYYKEISLMDSNISKKHIRENIDSSFFYLKEKYSFLNSYSIKIKTSIFSTLMSYMGVSGYYNPFTSEAQINKNIPMSIYPFTVCHEISHQLGIAYENEANFIGFLACLESNDDIFKYSGFFQMYLYTYKNLSRKNRERAKEIGRELSPYVDYDISMLKNYYKEYDAPILDKMTSIFYDNYLKANKQKNGIKSYNYVVNMLIKYYIN